MSANVTKEGIEVKVGQIWKDLDKRMNGRTRTVIAIENNKAQLDGYPKRWISISRMHRSSTGWALVRDVEGAYATR